MTGVTQDEPVTVAATAPPGRAAAIRRRRCRSAAERSPRGDGRVYRIAATVDRLAWRDVHRRGHGRGSAPPDRPQSTPRRRATTRCHSAGRSTSIPTMFIDVRLFAMLRERAGSDSVTVEVPDGATVRDAVDAVARHARARRRDRAHVGRDGGEPRVRGRRRAPGRGRRAGPDPAGQRRRDDRRRSRPARATSSSWSWSASTCPRSPNYVELLGMRPLHAEPGHVRCEFQRQRAVPEPGRHRAGRLRHRDARRDDGPGGDRAARARATSSRRSS